MFAHLISQLPNLQAIVFGTSPDDYAKHDEGVQLQLVEYLGKTCPALTHVVISLTNWHEDWIWTRDSDCGDMDDLGATWLGIVSKEPVNLEDLARGCDMDNDEEEGSCDSL
jgi:hypothetical protein